MRIRVMVFCLSAGISSHQQLSRSAAGGASGTVVSRGEPLLFRQSRKCRGDAGRAVAPDSPKIFDGHKARGHPPAPSPRLALPKDPEAEHLPPRSAPPAERFGRSDRVERRRLQNGSGPVPPKGRENFSKAKGARKSELWKSDCSRLLADRALDQIHRLRQSDSASEQARDHELLFSSQAREER